MLTEKDQPRQRYERHRVRLESDYLGPGELSHGPETTTRTL